MTALKELLSMITNNLFNDLKLIVGEKNIITNSQDLEKFNKVLILIDDIRCFIPNNEFTEYPSINDLVHWSQKNNFNWIIEHDIFIMFNFDYK